MPSLGSLWYTMGIRDMTDADIQKINAKLKNAGSEIQINPKLAKSINEILPKGIKLELDPQLKSISNDALAKAAEGKVMKVEIAPLITNLRKALKDATVASPPEIEVGVQAVKLRNLISQVLTRQGFMINVSTVTGNFSKTVQQQLNGTTYKVKIHADASEIARSVQTSLMQMQSRYFGLQVSKDILRNSIDQALMGKPFNIQIAVMHDQARRAVQNALNNARMVGKDDALAFQRLQTGELRAAQAELARLKAAHMGAAEAAKTHASASINLGGALGSNIKIAGELGSAMASLYSIHAAKQFLSQVVEIGGELEHQKIALETIYGSTSKMESLYGQIKGLARQSPFGVMDLTKNIKQLSAYGVAYNEVYDTAKRLADISAATSVDINRLILAFGKTKNRTFLDGLEAKQFAYANIPIYDALSKKLTELEGKFVSVRDVMGRIKKREIGFDMVKEILWDMTDEGGKFYNMQEKLAGSVKTSWKLVRDNIELMFGEIAESGVGDWLKGIGQTLQELTRSWKAFSGVLATGAIAFGTYRLVAAGANVLIEKQVGALAANHLAEKNVQAAKLRSIGITSSLSAREKELIATRNRLTATDLEYLFVEKGLSTEEIKRLFLSGKIARAELQKAVALGVLTQKEFEQIAGTTALNGAWLRFNATLVGTWANIKYGAASAFGMIFNWTTAVFAAIAGVVYLIQHNLREDEIADNFSKTWKQKGEDMGKSISESLSKPFENISVPEASQLIEEYKNLIKDFSTLPEDAIQRAIYDKDGNIRNTAVQIKYLREELESLKKTADSMSTDMGTIIGATGDGWFNEDVITDIKDYADAFNKANSIYVKFVSEHKEQAQGMVDAARTADVGFAQEIGNAKTLVEQFTILMRNRGRFSEAWKAAQGEEGYWATRGGSFLGSFKLWNTSSMEASIKEARAAKEAFGEINNAIAGFKTLHADWDWGNLSESQSEEVRQFYKQLIEASETSAPELRNVIADTFQNAFEVKIITDKTEDNWISNARKVFKNCADEGTKEALRVLQIDGANKLTDEQRRLIQKLFQTADDETKKQLPDLFGNAQSWINQHSLFWRIQYFFDNKEGKLSQAAQDIISSKGGTSGLSSITTDLLREVDGEGKSVWDIRNALKEKRQEVKNKMDADIKAGLNETTETFKADKQAYDNVEKVLKELDWTDLATKDEKSNKQPNGSKKDTLAESLRQRFKDIKDAWSEFQKWSKTEGREAAATRIGESGLFSTLSVEQIPQTVEQYRALVVQLENELRKAGVKGSARESLFNDLLKQLLDIDKTVVDEQLKLALDKVSKEAERQLADWNLFDKIRKATGNQDLAMSIAFGMNADAETDYPAMAKKQFSDLAKALGHDIAFDNTTLEQAKNLGDDIAKSYQDTASKLEKYAREQKDAIADILNEYQSLQDKLTKIDAERSRKIEAVNKSDMSDADKEKYAQRINVEADYQKFTQSNEYLQFFAGVYALTEQEATRIGDLIEQNLNRRLQAGTISAEDYYKEIERVKQQLDKLRNVKSDAMTFLTGGVKGLNDKRQETNDAARLQTIQKIEELEQNLAEAKASGDMYAVSAAEAQLEAAEKELSIQDKIRDKLIQNQQRWQKILDIANIASSIAGGMSDAFNSIKDMADALGADTESGAWGDIGAVMDTLTSVTGGIQKTVQSAMSGDIGGVLGGVVSTITTPFTIWSKLHDKKLQKLIDRSKEAAQIMQNQYDILEKRMASFLGNAANMNTGVTGGAYGKQRQLMQGQLTELEKQRQAEIDKKKTDNSVVEDYNKQIEEMKISIRDFAQEAAKDLYSIDLNGWAEQLGNSLVDAFAAGEDAAEAFDKTVGDILRDVTSKMISQDILAPMFGDLRNFLFGENGMGGAFGADFKLDSSEVSAMKEYLDKIKNQGIPAAEELFNAINSATGGMLDDTEKAKSGLSAGIQSVTEDTADLLASYVNAIRASVALNEGRWERLLGESLPQIGVIAQSQLDAQRQIAENTLRTAKATEAIVKSNDDISRLLTRVSQGGAKFHV